MIARLPARLLRLRPRRVPVRRQLQATECGAACLAMILSFHGRHTATAEVRDRCGVGRDGLTSLALAQAARSFGLKVRAFSAEPHHLGDLPLPAIAHWEMNHYVVIERWSPGRVDVVDPAVGRRRLTASELDAGLSGVVLTFEPGELTDAPAPDRAWWPLVRSGLREAPGTLVQVVLASVALQLFGLALPVCSELVVDDVIPTSASELLAPLAVGFALLAATQLVLGALRAFLLVHLQTRVDLRLVPGLFAHLLRLPFRFFEQRTIGDLLLRLASTSVLRDTLTAQTLSLVLDGGLVVGYLALLLWRDPIFGLVVVALGAVQVALVLASAPRLRDLTARDLRAQAEAHGYLVEALDGIATLKASAAEERALDRYLELLYARLDVSVRQARLSALVESAMATLRMLAPLVLLWVGALRVLDGAMSVGAMLAVSALGAAVLLPLQSLVQNGQRLATLGAHLERIADVMRARPEQPDGMRQAPALTGRIELRGVSFRYDEHGPWVLRDVSFAVEPGSVVALVGRTGCGKTTLTKLLLGLVDPVEGQVLVDGLPLDELDYRSVRAQVGVVLQEPFLFSGTIRDNIAFGDRGLPLAAVAEAARLAAIHDDVARLPMGYETRLAEGGGGLSGGQRQRLSLARALCRAPAILILDEATSHLDVETERIVDRNLRTLSCTRIVVAHRLSTVLQADLVLVVDEGRIVEAGPPAELLARGGRFASAVGGGGGARSGPERGQDLPASPAAPARG